MKKKIVTVPKQIGKKVLCNSRNNCCALGVLLLHCGFNKEDLKYAADPSDVYINFKNQYGDFTYDGFGLIEKHFKLSMQEQEEIIVRNDKSKTSAQARKRFIEVLKQKNIEYILEV